MDSLTELMDSATTVCPYSNTTQLEEAYKETCRVLRTVLTFQEIPENLHEKRYRYYLYHQNWDEMPRIKCLLEKYLDEPDPVNRLCISYVIDNEILLALS